MNGIQERVGVRVTIGDRIRVDTRDLTEEIVVKIKGIFTHRNSSRESKKRANVRGWWLEPEVIATWGEDGPLLTLPRGGMSKLREYLTAHGLAMKIRDSRESGAPEHPDLFPDTKVVLRPYQERIVAGCVAKQNCLIKSGTGSGKTTALIALFARLKVPTLVLVHSNALLKQWVTRVGKELGIKPRDLGFFRGAKKRKLAPLTIATTASFKKHARDPEVRAYFGAVLADEVHLFAAATFFACIDPMPAKYRVGVSDDARRKDRKEFLIYDLFGSVEVEVKDAELIAAKAVLDVECLIVPTEFEAPWYGVPEDEDDEKRLDFGRLVGEMSIDPARRALVERIIASELKDGRQIVVMAHEREHVRDLWATTSKYAPSGYLLGGQGADAREFDRTVKGLDEGTIRAGVGTYQACGTGIDIPSLEVVVASTPCMNNRQRFRQGRGRACRAPPGKTVARFYVLWDRHVYGIRAVENVASWNRTTFVWDGKEWVPVRQWLKRARASK